MPDLTPRQAVEVFHLVFLAHLSRKLDKKLFALKGGCNLRFFHKSVRYSEDMDLDVETVGVDTLRKNVRALLESTPLRLVLEPRGLAVTGVSEPKQTATTQRWKLGLRVPGESAPVRTKIEFSRRGLGAGKVFGPVDPELVRRYGLGPTLLPHYDADAALAQKIGALAGRAETQARDVFDLNLLLDAGASLTGRRPRGLREARERALDLTFADFKGQVWAFLDPGHQELYATKRSWEEMVLRVVTALGGEAA